MEMVANPAVAAQQFEAGGEAVSLATPGVAEADAVVGGQEFVADANGQHVDDLESGDELDDQSFVAEGDAACSATEVIEPEVPAAAVHPIGAGPLDDVLSPLRSASSRSAQRPYLPPRTLFRATKLRDLGRAARAAGEAARCDVADRRQPAAPESADPNLEPEPERQLALTLRVRTSSFSCSPTICAERRRRPEARRGTGHRRFATAFTVSANLKPTLPWAGGRWAHGSGRRHAEATLLADLLRGPPSANSASRHGSHARDE